MCVGSDLVQLTRAWNRIGNSVPGRAVDSVHHPWQINGLTGNDPPGGLEFGTEVIHSVSCDAAL
jgi:hypothetical protein